MRKLFNCGAFYLTDGTRALVVFDQRVYHFLSEFGTREVHNILEKNRYDHTAAYFKK